MANSRRRAIRHFQYLLQVITSWSVLSVKIMQPVTYFHDGIPHPILQEADVVLHDPVAFHPTNGVSNTDSNGGNTTIRRFLRGRQFSSTRRFLGLDERDVLPAEALKALILIQTTARWQGILSQLGHALIRGFAFRGMAKKAHVIRLSDHEEVFKRVALLHEFGLPV